MEVSGEYQRPAALPRYSLGGWVSLRAGLDVSEKQTNRYSSVKHNHVFFFKLGNYYMFRCTKAIIRPTLPKL
jgi:hypothetical protein